MDGNSPRGGQGAPPPPSGGQPPAPMNVGPPPSWPIQPQPGPTPKRRGLLIPIGVIAAVVLSAAALIVSLAKVGGKSPSQESTEASEPGQVQIFDDDADRSLCLAIGPLMRESNDMGNAFQDAGQQDSPERKAAIPKFVTDTYEWARKAQGVLNEHSDPSRFLTRNFQRYIDDTLLFAEGLSPERDSSAYENQIYELSIKDTAGLIGRCSEVDAPWWN